MDIAEDTDPPGPQFFPMIIMIVGYVLTILLTIAYIRNPEPVDVDDDLPAEVEEQKAFSTPVTSAVSASRLDPHEEDEPSQDRKALAEARADDSRHRTHSDFVSLAWGAGGFAAFALILEFAGWILAAALLFWCVARSMGSKRPLFDLTMALTFSSSGLHRVLGVAGAQSSFGNLGRWLLIWTLSCPSSKASHTH